MRKENTKPRYHTVTVGLPFMAFYQAVMREHAGSLPSDTLDAARQIDRLINQTAVEQVNEMAKDIKSKRFTAVRNMDVDADIISVSVAIEDEKEALLFKLANGAQN
ncbi:hypothetical protein Brsp06_03479 [Brucella sp. NBRC 13694]|uniref:hypothetical protein n=1 Tax=Brucella sp. NBRC 13694 TaxID=3075482 RepID=UPI0030ADFDFE